MSPPCACPPHVYPSVCMRPSVDNNMIICKNIFSRCNQYFKAKTKLICNRELKAGARLLAQQLLFSTFGSDLQPIR